MANKKTGSISTSSSYIEAGDYQSSYGWTKDLGTLALAGIVFQGFRYGINKLDVPIGEKSLSYLREGLPGFDDVAGYAKGATTAPLRDVLLDKIKWAEEGVLGIPRTFGVSDFMSTGTLTRGTSQLHIPGENVREWAEHFEDILQRKLSAGEKLQGLHVAPFTEEQLKQAFPETATELIKEGAASPGKRPGLFSVGPEGQPGRLLVPDVDIHAARWAPEGVDPRHVQTMENARYRAEGIGARFPGQSEFPYQVTKARGEVKLRGVIGEAVGTFADVPQVEDMLSKYVSPRTQRAIESASILSKRLMVRYLKLLDRPLETIEEITTKPGLFKGLKGTSGYGLFRDVLGTGGDYRGNVADLTMRHGVRLAGLAVAGAAVYQAGSYATEALFNRDVGQVGAEALAASERLYAKTSDVSGLTALNKFQKEEAEGSNRLLGVLAFPLSGYLTGRIVAAATHRTQLEEGQFAWRAAREEVHRLPEVLKPLEKLDKVPGFGKISGQMTRGHLFGLVGAAIGGALSLPFLLGSLGSGRSYDEVSGEQKGEVETAVRKGANWEMGRTDIEGGRVNYYGEHWYARAMNKGKDELMFDEYQGRPFTRMIKNIIDPYWREKKFYHERPYPVTGADTSGFGPLGTLWGATVGRVIKPTKYMHGKEIAGGPGGVEEGEVIRYGSGAGAPAPEMGGTGPAAAVSPYSGAYLAGEQIYKITEAAGLPGFAISALKQKITGSPDFGDQAPVLESFSSMGSFRNRFWESNVGGGFTTTEALRRLIAPERWQIQKVNPIENTMPSWLPGAEYYTDFQHGDPYDKVDRGEERLPGPGLAERFPELKGLAYEDYPDIYKYKVLADVAPYSKQLRNISRNVSQQAAEGSLTPAHQLLYEGTKTQLEEKDKRIRVREETGLIGSYWGAITRAGRLNPVEHLLPVSPVHKFAGPTDALTTYETNEIYGTESPYWGSPIKDFLAPAARIAGSNLGFSHVPEGLQRNREVEEYFDKIEYMKNRRLASAAKAQGDSQAAFGYTRRAERTMYGMNPYAEVSEIERALPKADRTYFKELVKAETPSERGRVLAKVPSYVRKFYKAQWEKKEYGDLVSKDSASSRKQMHRLQQNKAFEGLAFSERTASGAMGEIESGRLRETELPNYIRDRNLESYFETEAPWGAPGSDWVGWDPSVTTEDIKLKVVQNEGADHHDFDIWEDQVAEANRKPYLDSGAEEVLYSDSRHEREIRNLLAAQGMKNSNVGIMPEASGRIRIEVDVAQDRRRDIEREFRGRRH